ncbi:hypothetical protein [Methyloferula stellata]|jgi:hypothetical protein|uniref:hypothetical protein n=1 Tax=Methyloferula stellata TaxID=876270 RepID=UPI00037748C2|nr:hypothetical protein [Methyloferula stellata]
MIRQITLSLVAFGLMAAAADAAQMPVAPEKPGVAMKAPALTTGRSAYYHHWHHRWHRHWHR